MVSQNHHNPAVMGRSAVVTLYSGLFPSVLLLKDFAYTALPVQAWAGGSQLKEVFIYRRACHKSISISEVLYFGN